MLRSVPPTATRADKLRHVGRVRNLNGEVRADVVLVHGRALAARDYLAARQHDVMVGQRLGEVIVLLDQKNRDIARSDDLRMARLMS
jgi:hypothetical protein